MQAEGTVETVVPGEGEDVTTAAQAQLGRDAQHDDAVAGIEGHHATIAETDNANINASGSVRFGNGRVVSLDTGNGIIMLRVAPKLRSSQSGSDLTFTWDNGLDGPFRLQSSPTLTPAVWSDVTGGGTSGVTVTAAASGNLFFRLIN